MNLHNLAIKKQVTWLSCLIKKYRELHTFDLWSSWRELLGFKLNFITDGYHGIDKLLKKRLQIDVLGNQKEIEILDNFHYFFLCWASERPFPIHTFWFFDSVMLLDFIQIFIVMVLLLHSPPHSRILLHFRSETRMTVHCSPHVQRGAVINFYRNMYTRN